MTPLLLIPAAGAGLWYFFLRKPANAFVPQPITAAPVAAAASPAQAVAAVAPPGSPQAAVDQAIVNTAFQQMQGSQAPQDTFTPGDPNGPPPISVVTVDPASTAVATLAQVAQAANDPFGALGSLLSNGGAAPAPSQGPQDSNLSFDPGSGLNKNRPDLSGTTTEPAGFFDDFNPFGD